MDKQEGIICLEALLFISSIDEDFDESEKIFVAEFGKELGFSNEETDAILSNMNEEDRSLEEILAEIENEETKISLLNILIDLCHADGKYSKAEKNGVAEISRMLNVDGKTLKKLEMEYIARGGKQAFWKGVGAVKNGLAFVGGKGVAGGKFVASGIGKAGSKLADAVKSAKKQREENKKLRAELKKTTITEAVKQKIILQLNSKISSLKMELKREKARNEQNEEIIKLLQAQLEDLEKTIEAAEAAKTA